MNKTARWSICLLLFLSYFWAGGTYGDSLDRVVGEQIGGIIYFAGIFVTLYLLNKLDQYLSPKLQKNKSD